MQAIHHNWADKYDVKALTDDDYPAVTISVDGTPEPTHKQKVALFRKWRRDDNGYTWDEFARSIGIMLSNDNAVVVQWCGMWLCIEEDGHCHT